MSINQDRPCTCMFFFADGRRCQMPPSADDMDLCYFHAKKYQDHLNAQGSRPADQRIPQQRHPHRLRPQRRPRRLSSPATSLGSHQAQDHHRPHLSRQPHAQTQRLAKDEFLESFKDRWPKIVRESIVFNEPAPEPAPATPKPPDPSDSGSSDNPDTDPTPTGIHPLPNRKIVMARGGACPILLGFRTLSVNSVPSGKVKSFPLFLLVPQLLPNHHLYKLIQNKPLHLPAESITFKKQGGGGVSNQLTLGARSLVSKGREAYPLRHFYRR